MGAWWIVVPGMTGVRVCVWEGISPLPNTRSGSGYISNSQKISNSYRVRVPGEFFHKSPNFFRFVLSYFLDVLWKNS